MTEKEISIRIYYDSNKVLQAQSLHESPIPDDYVFKTVFPIGNVPGVLFFTDMDSIEAQRLSISGMEEILIALGNEGMRVNPQKEGEQYYMGFFAYRTENA